MQGTVPLVVVVGALFAGGMAVYHALLRRIVVSRNKVRSDEYEITDLLMTLFLTGLLGVLLAWVALHRVPQKQIDPDSVLPNSLTLLLPALGLGAFMHYRKISLPYMFGLYRMSVVKAFLQGFGLILAALPLVFVAGLVTQKYLDSAGGEQELVKLFRDMVKAGDTRVMIRIAVAGVVLAPFSEEFLFRGYFYGVLKRYCGPWVSAAFTAAFFAAMHMNLASLLSLFVLALCLTVAYEATGCLLVPMVMHGLFNLAQLTHLYLNSRG